MRSRFIVLALVFVSFAAVPARALELELGPRLAVSLPMGEMGTALERGMDAGLTVTVLRNRTSGAGVDVGYQRWPGSLSYLPMSGAVSSHFDEIGLSWHVKMLVPIEGPVRPWVRAGTGLYDLRARVEVPGSGAAKSFEWKTGGFVGLGFDQAIGGGMKTGLDASLRYLLLDASLRGRHLTTVTLGAHVLFSPASIAG